MKPAARGRRSGGSLGVVAMALAGVVSACASAPPAPPPPPPVSFEQKLAWILRLEDERRLRDPTPPPAPPPRATRRRLPPAPPPPPPPDLIRLLGDAEARVRRRAALAVGRVGLREAVAPLARILAEDPEPEVRQMAAFALGLLGDAGAAPVLIAALAEASPLVQGRAAAALGRLGVTTAADAIGRMVARYVPEAARLGPDDMPVPLPPSLEAFRLGAGALAELKAFEPLAAAVLDPQGRPRVRWWPVAYALARVEDRRALAALASVLQDEGVYGAAVAARGLAALKDPSAVDRLVPLLDPARRHPFVVAAALRALADQGGPKAAAAILKLALLRELPPVLRVEAVTALGKLSASGATELLLDLLADPWPTLRAAALLALARCDPDTFVVVLATRDPDPHWSVRAALADALEQVTPSVAVPRLMAMLGDADRRVVPAVLRALVRLKAPGIDRIVLDQLKADDPVVRMAAARALGDLKPSGAETALAAAYQAGLGDATYLARAAALDALARYGGKVALGTLTQALNDRDWAVRLRAATHLAALDPATDYGALIRPAPPGPMRTDYQAAPLVAPSVSPHAYLDFELGTVEIELDVLNAPLTVANFIRLVGQGFFDGLAVHRVVPGFVVQMGDPRADGEGGPGYTIRDELNELPVVRGSVGMALDWADTGGSQFFITLTPQPQLEGRYTVFGRVVGGMDVIDRLKQWDVLRRARVWDGETMHGR